MLLNLSAPLLTPAAYPDLTETNPKRKKKAFILQYGRAFLSQCLTSNWRHFYGGRHRYAVAKAYYDGTHQPVMPLKDGEGNSDDVRNEKLDFRPLPILTRPMRAVEGMLKDHDFVATVTPIDATAQDERRAYEARLRAYMAHGEFLQSLGLGDNPAGQGMDIPVDEDELALHMDLGYRHRDAMLLEMKLALAFYLSRYEDINRECLRYEQYAGVSVVHLQQQGPRRLPVSLNPGDCFFLPAKSETFPNLQAGAHIERIPLARVLDEIEQDPDTTLDKQQIEHLKSLARTSLNNGHYWVDPLLEGAPEMAGQLEVIRFSFVSTDEMVFKEYTNKFGNPQIREKAAGYKNMGGTPGKVYRPKMQNVYEGSLIVGTDIGYGARLAYEQLRDEDNPMQCHPFYVVTAPGLLNGEGRSLVELCMSPYDMFQREWLNLQHSLAIAMPWWLKFNRTALMAIAGEKDAQGKALGLKEALRFVLKNRIAVGDEFTEDDKQLGKFLEAGETPMFNEVNMRWQNMQAARQEIEAISGVNQAVAAGNAQARVSNGVTEQAVQGAENTLELFYHAKQSRFERVARALAASIKQSEARAPLTGPVQTGSPLNARVQVVEASATLPERTMAVKIERKPSEREWADFYETAKVALTQKEITLGDYNFLRQIDNLKQAGAMLGIRAKRNQMQAAQAKQAETEMLATQQQKSSQVTGEEARKTAETQFQFDMQLEQLRGQNAREVALIQARMHTKNNQTTAQAAFDKQQLIEQGKREALAAEHEHKHGLTAMQEDAEDARLAETLASQERQAEAQRKAQANKPAAR